jgi:hypothetical protein
LVRSVILAANGFGLGEGGDFHHFGSTEIDAEYQTLINHKTVFGTRNPAFWVCAISGSGFFLSFIIIA